MRDILYFNTSAKYKRYFEMQHMENTKEWA